MDEVSVKIPPGDSQETFTGERYIPSVTGEIAWEHLHRYAVAIQLCKGKQVLDIACGEGYGSYMLSQVASGVVGVDIDEPTVLHAIDRYRGENLSFKVGRCQSIPCESHSFDVVVSFETIEHISDPDVFLAEILRVLRPGGFLIISSPERDTYNAGGKTHNDFHLNEMSEDEFSSVLRGKFRNVLIARQSSLFGSVLMPSQRAERLPTVFQQVDGVLHGSHTLRKTPYVVAVCTNSEELPALGASVFDSGLPPSTLSALEGGIAERDAGIRELILKHAQEECRVGALQVGVAERDVKIRDLSEQFVKSQEMLWAFQGGVRERDERIRELSDRLVSAQERAGALKGGIEERDETIRSLLTKCALLEPSEGQLGKMTPGQLRWFVEMVEPALESTRKELTHHRSKEHADRDEDPTYHDTLLKLEDDEALLARIHDAITGTQVDEVQETAALSKESRGAATLNQKDEELHSMTTSATTKSDSLRPSFVKTLKKIKPSYLGLRRAGSIEKEVVIELKEHVTSNDVFTIISDSQLFDPNFYRSQLSSEENQFVTDPLRHYLEQGDLRDFAPHPLFNPAHYRRYSMGACDQRQNTLAHYLSGKWVGRGVTSAIFDSRWYLEQNPDVAQSGINPLQHYINHGSFEGRWPSAWFNPQHYRGRFPELSPQQNPAIDFMLRGHSSYESPNLPQPSALDVSTNPTIHTILASEIFDGDYYRARLPEADLHVKLDPLWHYVTEGDALGLSPHPLFDASMYRRYQMTQSESRDNSLVHYLSGKWHGRGLTSFIFDSRWYLDANPDVLASGMNPLVHFLTRGSREGRWPILWFNPQKYREQFGLSPEDNAAVHFILRGHASLNVPELPLSYSFSSRLQRFASKATEPFESGELAGQVEMVSQLTSHCENLRSLSEEAPQVSVIIPVYNQLRYTLHCIESILRAQPKASFEIVVVNDCSSDETAQALEQLPRTRLINQEKNGGFISSCNLGAAEARGSYLLFLNNDTHVLPGWLDELLDTLESNPKAAIAGSQLIYPDGVLQEAGGIFWKDGSAWNYGRYGDPARPEFSYMRSVDWCSGASIMIAKERFEELGCFDPVYAPAYCEDVELAFRARQKGYEVLYQPYSKVVHFEGVSSGTDTTRGVKAYQVINLQRLEAKWREKLAHHGAPGANPGVERDRGAKGHVLFVDACFPTPDQDAGSIVAESWMKILMSLGYHVTFVAMHQFTHVARYTEHLNRLGVYCPLHPYDGTPEEFLRKTGARYDLVVACRHECSAMAYNALEQAGSTAPRIFLPIDLHYVREARLADLEGSAEKRVLSILTQYKELQVFLRSDLTCVHSSFERDELLKHNSEARIEVSPIMFPVPGRSAPFDSRKDICFIGGFRHTPNVDAMTFFVGEVWPLVVAKLPGVKLKIIGAGPPPEVEGLASDSVEICGFLRDLTPIFDAIKLSVAPLRYGAGVKGKVGISMSHGVPVVGTPMACEGMDLVEGKEVLVGRTPEELAAHIIQLYTDRALWYAVSDGGFARAHREYSLEGNVPLFERYLQQVGLEYGADHAPGEALSLMNG